MNRTPHHLSLVALAIAIVTMIATSCSSAVERGQFHNVDADGWAYGEPIVFRIDGLNDSVTTGSLVLAVRHSADYVYSNLWLEISRSSADTVIVDTIDVRLADVYGNWLGRGMGVSFQTADTIARHIAIADSSDIAVRHIMRADRVEDIEQLGLIFIPDIQ